MEELDNSNNDNNHDNNNNQQILNNIFASSSSSSSSSSSGNESGDELDDEDNETAGDEDNEENEPWHNEAAEQRWSPPHISPSGRQLGIGERRRVWKIRRNENILTARGLGPTQWLQVRRGVAEAAASTQRAVTGAMNVARGVATAASAAAGRAAGARRPRSPRATEVSVGGAAVRSTRRRATSSAITAPRRNPPRSVRVQTAGGGSNAAGGGSNAAGGGSNAAGGGVAAEPAPRPRRTSNRHSLRRVVGGEGGGNDNVGGEGRLDGNVYRYPSVRFQGSLLPAESVKQTVHTNIQGGRGEFIGEPSTRAPAKLWRLTEDENAPGVQLVVSFTLIRHNIF